MKKKIITEQDFVRLTGMKRFDAGKEFESLPDAPDNPFDKIGADKLAYECARQILLNRVDSRSGIGDALLNYLHIGGGPGTPDSVPQWMKEYEKA